MNPEIFREYDIRGVVDSEIDDKTAELIGRAYGTMIAKLGGKKVVVGRDNRRSGPRILKALLSGIMGSGINVIYIGEIPTPLLYYAVHKLVVDGGISVTASHNPPQFNGFKAMVGRGAIYGNKIQELRKIAESGKFAAGKTAGKLEEKSLDEDYLEEIASIVTPGKRLKVVVDAGNGMASELAPKLMSMIGCEVVPLFCEKIADYPNHIPDPVEEKNVVELMKRVVKERADIGIAFDGDADRIGVVDEKGGLIYGDRLLGLFAADLLTRKPGAKIIFEVKCSQGLEEWIVQKGGKPLMWKTGHSLIKAKMKEEGASLAGEMSGHMFFTEKWYGFDDALLAAVKIVEIVSNSGKALSDLVAEMPSYASSPEYRVDCPDREKFDFVEKAKGHFRKKFRVIEVDGARVLFEQGWALIRASNTQPKLILRFEGKTKEALESVKKQFLAEIKAFSGKKIEIP